MAARGSILGLTRGTGRDHIIRAALESIAYQTEDVLAAMQADMASFGSGQITSLKADGGASHNRLLMQFQSDLSGIPVLRPATAEATAWGAAALAGLGIDFFGSPEETLVSEEGSTVYTPHMADDRRTALLDGWHRAVEACRAF
jgi:glycerol kinase